jgi:hypothetical protein
MAIIGGDDFPSIEKAGNVVRPKSSVVISMRVCPALDVQKAKDIIVKKLTENPPYNA